jgi:hypothetical protein
MPAETLSLRIGYSTMLGMLGREGAHRDHLQIRQDQTQAGKCFGFSCHTGYPTKADGNEYR